MAQQPSSDIDSPSPLARGHGKPSCGNTNMPKRMRKGTHSCVTCRRRKVRCSYAPGDSKICVNCAKRNVPCIPQGDIRPGSDTHNTSAYTERKGVSNICLLSFFDALGHLRRWVQLPASSLTPTQLPAIFRASTELGQFVNDPKIIRSEHAPVIKLFNDLRMGHTIQTGTNGDPGRAFNSQQNAKQIDLIRTALTQMLSVLPSNTEIQMIFQNRSRWWETWRQSFGLGWGENEDKTFESFATRAVCTVNPSLLGSLLVCFALSSGDHDRYLKPVEHWIMDENNFTGHVYDFQCIVALGLGLFSALQPSRAWSVFRTASTRLQLAGIHKHHRKSEPLDATFWQIFGADRWVSLLIGLPYSSPDHLCDLEIPEITQSSYISFHYRHLTILTGRVIDVLQSDPPVSLSRLISVEESIDDITAQLPPNYLDMGEILACLDEPNKSARLYRLTHIHQLKAFLYLPVFLQTCDGKGGRVKQRDGDSYGKLACTNSARAFLDAFLALFDLDPGTASVDNSIKLTAFTALSAAVVLYLNRVSCKGGLPSQIEQSFHSIDSDMALIHRCISVLQICSEGRQESLCGQCHRALLELISCGNTIHQGGSRQIPVPYFGTITIIRGKENETSKLHEPCDRSYGGGDTQPHLQPAPSDEDIQLDNIDPFSPVLLDDIAFSYQGPWETHELGFDWLNLGVDLTSDGYGFANLDAT